MNNQLFLAIIQQSFLKFLQTGSRSNEKLKILHGNIAKDLSERLGNKYQIQSLGFDRNKEGKIEGRYIDKNVDITIIKNKKPIAGIGVKFVMQNYAQNSNNDFENMLGETANIRSNNIPYFQIFIIPEFLPYYEGSNSNIKRRESFNTHHIKKYIKLSNDNEDLFFHIPTKTIIYVLKLPDCHTQNIINKTDYINYYANLQDFNLAISENEYGEFGANIILNNYELFVEKVVYRILSI